MKIVSKRTKVQTTLQQEHIKALETELALAQAAIRTHRNINDVLMVENMRFRELIDQHDKQAATAP